MLSQSIDVEWRGLDEGLKPFYLDRRGRRVPGTWAPLPGSQQVFLDCTIFETIYEGTRGPGKTDALLIDFAQHCGPDVRTRAMKAAGVKQKSGWGAEWRGVLFRRTYPELADVIEKSHKVFRQVWPEAEYNKAKSYWRWPTGETLLFRHFSKPDDYWSYHGHAYPWQGWEELTTWPNLEGYKRMFACARSTIPGIPIKIRSTTNPYGIGHNVVKARWRLPVPAGSVRGPVIRDSRDSSGELEPPRVAIHGTLSENKVLLYADPNYVSRIRAAARNPAELKAWLYGSWDIVAGGMFDDIWNPLVHLVPDLPLNVIPRGWRLDRSYDHGQSAPFSVGWWAESNGEPIELEGRVLGEVPGDLFRIAEWYGWNGNAEKPEGVRMLSTDIAEGIADREKDWGLGGRVKPGPADTNIFDDYEPQKSVAGDMQKKGIRWTKADKGQGSRSQGWEQLRKLLVGSLPTGHGPREEKGLFICRRCTQFQRTFPVLPRSDKNLDDVNSDAEDHIGDEVRYRARGKRTQAGQVRYR